MYILRFWAQLVLSASVSHSTTETMGLTMWSGWLMSATIFVSVFLLTNKGGD